jgi:hypothetical protein
MARTAHESSQQLQGYGQRIGLATDLNLGELALLDVALRVPTSPDELDRAAPLGGRDRPHQRPVGFPNIVPFANRGIGSLHWRVRCTGLGPRCHAVDLSRYVNVSAVEQRDVRRVLEASLPLISRALLNRPPLQHASERVVRSRVAHVEISFEVRTVMTGCSKSRSRACSRLPFAHPSDAS